MGLFLGLMSGTSLDGVDAVLAELSDVMSPAVRGHHHLPMPPGLRAELLALNSRGGSDELHRAGLAANAVSRLYAQAAGELLQRCGVAADQVIAIGAHGQTVRHRPGEFDGNGYTVQLLNGALLAERCGIDVVCDLRQRDVAAGGQGAPLVPGFHAAVFAHADEAVAVLNLGGIGNLTLIGPGASSVIGFDCGPGNLLLDLWCAAWRGLAFDADGRWAASGRVHTTLLSTMLADPFFAAPPPKSTGRDRFDRAWIDRALALQPSAIAPADVQATLAELTVQAAARALLCHAPETKRLLVCGGGARNGFSMQRLVALLQGMAVHTTEVAGVPADQVEALAFAWLAAAFVERRPGNLPAVTGAAGLRLLGALYPA
jgi:anhydro-N-acetylmuramic acid kinase